MLVTEYYENMTPVVLTCTPTNRHDPHVLCGWHEAGTSHILCPVSCYLIQLGYKKIHENLTYFLFYLEIYLWQSSKKS